jgi:ureidoglycolate hydrolase
MNIKLHKLTHENIKPYGYIIDKRCVKDNGKGNRFGILLKVKSDGWRIAYLIVRSRTITRIEYHDSLETFEPVSGRVIIVLATYRNPEKVKVFLLDKPVVLKKGIWHDVAAVSKRAELKIFENRTVGGGYHYLKNIINV